MSAALAALLLASPYVWVEDGPRLDHRGQVALFASPVFEQLVITRRGAASSGLMGELLLGIPAGDQGYLTLGARAGSGEPLGRERPRLVAPLVGYRGYAGGESTWKTFLDLGLMLRIEPALGAGARVGAGIQYELSENLGGFLGGGIGLAGGQGVHLSGDVALGLQVRFGSAGDHSAR